MFTSGADQKKLFGERIDLTGRGGGESRQNIFKPSSETDVAGFACCRERVEDSQALPADKMKTFFA